MGLDNVGAATGRRAQGLGSADVFGFDLSLSAIPSLLAILASASAN